MAAMTYAHRLGHRISHRHSAGAGGGRELRDRQQARGNAAEAAPGSRDDPRGAGGASGYQRPGRQRHRARASVSRPRRHRPPDRRRAWPRRQGERAVPIAGARPPGGRAAGTACQPAAGIADAAAGPVRRTAGDHRSTGRACNAAADADRPGRNRQDPAGRRSGQAGTSVLQRRRLLRQPGRGQGRRADGAGGGQGDRGHRNRRRPAGTAGGTARWQAVADRARHL
jgi:hypothetical protein